MEQYQIYLLIAFFVVVLFIGPTGKALLAFLLMTSFFDVTPPRMFGVELWDVGIVLLYLAMIHLAVTGRFEVSLREWYERLLLLFIIWLGFCFAWSYFVLGYPPLEIIQCSRQMLLGYPIYFIFLSLFDNKRRSFDRFMGIVYYLVAVLMVAHIIQYATQIKILQGLVTSYRDVIRALPICLPLALVFMWRNLARLLAGKETSLFDKLFVVLTLYSVLITFTRGIYFSVTLSGLLLFMLMLLEQRMIVSRVAVAFVVVLLGFGVLLTTDTMQWAVERGLSGLNIVIGRGMAVNPKYDGDTYHGRIALVTERLEMVMEENPLVGFGFMHERLAKDMGIRVRVGGLRTDGYSKSVSSADIAWGNIVIYTGIMGLLLFSMFLLAVAFSYLRGGRGVDDDRHYLRLAFFVQFFGQVALMFNGNNFTNLLHIPMLMLAGYAFCGRPSKEVRNDAAQCS
jgi:hypothetical protein